MYQGRDLEILKAVIGEYFASAAGATARLYAPFAAAAHRCAAKEMMRPQRPGGKDRGTDLEEEWQGLDCKRFFAVNAKWDLI